MEFRRAWWFTTLLVLVLAVGLVGCLETEEDDNNDDDRDDPVGPVDDDLLEVSQPGMNFMYGEGPGVITLTYNGTDTLHWYAESYDSWIDVAPGEGVFTAEGDEAVLTVSISRDGMAVGEHEGLVTISSVDETISFYVKMTVQEQEEPEEVEILNWSNPITIDENNYSYSEEFENEYQYCKYRVEINVTEVTGDFGVELILLNGSYWTAFSNGVNYGDHGSLVINSPGTYELTTDDLVYNSTMIIVVDYSDLGDVQTDGGSSDHATFTLTAYQQQVIQ